MEDSEILTSALNILRRIHPTKSKEIVAGLIKLNPKLKIELLRRSFLPFTIIHDEIANKYFIGCEYNQDESNYRSPWSPNYFPSQLKTSYFPNEQLKALETELNELFELYLKAYYQTGISSVYLWELNSKNGFAGCFCICKEFELEDESQNGNWTSMHIIKVMRDPNNVTYSLNSELSLQLKGASQRPACGLISRLSRSKDYLIDATKILPDKIDTHIIKIGEIIDESETWFRSRVENIFMPKLNAVINETKPFTD